MPKFEFSHNFKINIQWWYGIFECGISRDTNWQKVFFKFKIIHMRHGTAKI